MNQIEKIEEEIDTLREEYLQTKNDVEWIKKFQWAVIVSAVGGLVVGIINLL